MQSEGQLAVKKLWGRTCNSLWTNWTWLSIMSLAALKPSSLLGWISKSIATRWREVIILLYLALMRLQLERLSRFEPLKIDDKLKRNQQGPHQNRRHGYYIEEEYQEAKFVQHGEGRLRKDLIMVLHYLMYCYREDKSRLWVVYNKRMRCNIHKPH